jgi:hypothetical protein
MFLYNIMLCYFYLLHHNDITDSNPNDPSIAGVVKFLDGKKSEKKVRREEVENAREDLEEEEEEEEEEERKEVSFLLDERVRNINGVTAVVTAVLGEGKYDILYTKCKTKVSGIDGCNLVKYIYVASSKSKKRSKDDWEIVVAPVESAEEYFKAANIDTSAVLAEGTKRARKQTKNS